MAETTSNKIDRLISALDHGFPTPQWKGILESILDESNIQGITMRQRWQVPNAATTTAGSAQKNLNGIAAGYAATSVISPDYPRNVNVTGVISNGAITELLVTFTGTDIFGSVVTETLTIDANETVQGSQIFATVTGIAVTGTFSTGGSTPDTLDTGFGIKFGLQAKVESDCMIKMNEDNDDSGKGDVTIDATYNSIVFETAPNAAHNYEAWYTGKA